MILKNKVKTSIIFSSSPLEQVALHFQNWSVNVDREAANQDACCKISRLKICHLIPQYVPYKRPKCHAEEYYFKKVNQKWVGKFGLKCIM